MYSEKVESLYTQLLVAEAIYLVKDEIEYFATTVFSTIRGTPNNQVLHLDGDFDIRIREFQLENARIEDGLIVIIDSNDKEIKLKLCEMRKVDVKEDWKSNGALME